MANQTDTNKWRPWVIVGTIVLLVLMWVVAYFSPTPNVGFESAAAVLAIVTATAVGIERVIEAGWTYIGQTWGTFWPMKSVSSEVNKFVSDLDNELKPFYDKAHDRMADLQKAGKWTADHVTTAREDLDNGIGKIKRLAALAPDNERAQLIATMTSSLTASFKQKYEELHLDNVAASTNQAIAIGSQFVDSFKDNPGRRLISIYIGTFLGLAVAGTLGLDALQAAAETTKKASDSGGLIASLFPHWGVALTGVLMGLGANPTHEVIRLVQELKKSRKAENREPENREP